MAEEGEVGVLTGSVSAIAQTHTHTHLHTELEYDHGAGCGVRAAVARWESTIGSP